MHKLELCEKSVSCHYLVTSTCPLLALIPGRDVVVTDPRSKKKSHYRNGVRFDCRCCKKRDASANDDPHKCYPTGPSSTDCGSKRRYTTTIQKSGRKKKLTLRKIVRHKSAVAHKLMRTTSPDPATRNAGSPILAEQTGELGVGNQRDVVVSSSTSENSASLLGNTQDASSDAPPLETEPPETVVDARSKLTSLKRPLITTTTPFSQCWRR